MSFKENEKTKKVEATDTKTDGKRLRPKWIIISIAAFVLVVFTVLAVIYFSQSNANRDGSVIQSKFSIHYTVSASEDPLIKVLGVSIRMDIEELSPEQMIYIYKGKISSPILSCSDDMGNTIETNQTTDLLSIGPIGTSAKSVTMKYDVMVGNIRNYTQAVGDFYEDLLVFSGEYVLMSPYLSYSDLQKTEDYISSVSFNLEADYNWKAIIPFQEPLSDSYSFKVERPTWSVFSSLNKSSYCFGQFVKQDLGVGDAVYVDKAAVDKIPYISSEILITFLNYYKDLFGELSSDAPLVLLRNSTENTVILGGVGANGAAISADLIYPDDLQTLSTTLYHLYFDSKIKAPNLRYPPNSWIYRGLANHHVFKSSTYLSQEVKDMYSIDIVDDPSLEYLDYLYFSIKEPDFLSQNPSLESEMDQVQGAFYMDVKVPVMISLINFAIADTDGGNFITALMDMAGKEKDLDIDKFLKTKCGNYYEAVMRCFSGNSIIPNYNNFKLDGRVSDEEITSWLTNTDTQFANLFSHGHGYVGYLSFPLVLLDTDVFYRDVEALGVRYSTDEIQEEIKGFSSTLHQYLLQYAMFAKLAGYDELTYENVKRMYTSENFDLWMQYCENVGFKDPVE